MGRRPRRRFRLLGDWSEATVVVGGKPADGAVVRLRKTPRAEPRD
ncbi:MAG: hypothetical protein R2991_16910 [Thermoanaerobaculia bacterium]